jgi:NAD(P)-dependent dehydrogenase (short-subunit alcohol dehydrogenase family)
MNNKNVLITGADKGLGLALTEKYLVEGCNVFACLYQEPSTAIMNLKEVHTKQLFITRMDVASDQSVEKVKQELKDETIDILINNAGVHFENSYLPLEQVDFNVALQTLNINSLGPLRVIKAFLPNVEKSSAKVIVNISSEAGSITDNFRDREFDYCMSKTAINMASVILQKYVKPKGIKVLAFHPGWMKTDMGGQNADIDATIAAESIIRLIDKYKKDIDGPLYMDYKGNKLNW